MKDHQDWQTNRGIDQWNTIRSPEIKPHRPSQLIFHKSNSMEKALSFTFVDRWRKMVPDGQVIKKKSTYTHIDCPPYRKINLNETMDLIVKWKHISHVEEENEIKSCVLRFGDEFLPATPKTWSMKKMLDFIKIKKLSFSKETVERQRTDWDKVFARHLQYL